MYRQGDVMVEACAVPDGAKRVEAEAGRLILARGEATGHHHSLVADAETDLYERDGVLYLRLAGVKVLEHQEHAPITLPPGDYRVARQVEYSPEEIRRVQD